MKTLKNHTLLYDAQCPLCVGYTNTFVQTGMLDENGRYPFQQIDKLTETNIDRARATNEIALVNTKTKEVYYGVDSLLRVLGSSFPWIERIGKWYLVHYLLNKLYAFISYNRKVIISNPPNEQNICDCEPTFNYPYRIIYIVFATLLSAVILTGYTNLLAGITYPSFYSFEISILIFQIPFQFLFLGSVKPKVLVNYTGHLVTVSFLGSLLLLPVWLVNTFIPLPLQTNILYFLLVATFLWFHHKQRVENLRLPSRLSMSWAAYRILLLLIIIYFS
ncbi:DCC1-like thiol-disulfide oxidoreductase family protein [Flavobacteriaceae bacterium M23B6Z8]